MTEITMAGNFDHGRATEEELEEAVEGLQQLIDAAFEPLVAFLERQKKTVPIGHGSEVADVYSHALNGQDEEAVRKWEEFQQRNRAADRSLPRAKQ